MPQSEEQELWTNPECLPCLITIAYDLLQQATNDSKVQITGMQNTYQILKKFALNKPPTDVANEIYHMIQTLTGKTDLFEEIKRKSNQLAKDAMQRIRPHVKAGATPQIRFTRGLAAAIAGNVIDFGTAGHSIELSIEFLEETYYEISKEGFAIDYSNALFEALQQAKEIVYVADNAGETFFDLLLLEQIKKFANIIFVVKGAPISNDATINDVQDPLFKKFTTKIITTGSGFLGVSLTDNSEEFREYLRKADLIIAKGQSNFETLYFYHRDLTTKPIYFVFRTKCLSIANFLEQTIGKNIILRINVTKNTEKIPFL